MSDYVVNNIAVLPLIGLADGSRVFTETVLAPWYYVAAGAVYTIDHVTVEATKDGGNTRWVRMPFSHPIWQSQNTWYIDPVSGNDENTGLSGSPIKSLAELMRRVADPSGKWTITHNVDGYMEIISTHNFPYYGG